MSFLWGNTAEQPREEKKFANISNDQINSNQQAQPVKYLAGRFYVAGDYITPAYNPKAIPVKTQAGKGESTTTGYKYFADFALVFCMGGRRPVDAIRKVIVDSDIRWKGNVVRVEGQNKTTIQVEDLGKLHLYWGTETQGIDTVLLKPRSKPIGGGDKQDSTTWDPNDAETGGSTYQGMAGGDKNPFSGHYDEHPAYRGQCYGVFIDWKLGRDRTAIPNIQLELQRGCPWINNGFKASDEKGVNPIAILYDWLTDTRFGMALPESQLNTASFTTAFNALESIGARLSPMISQQGDFRQVIAELLEYYDGWIRRNGTKIEVGVWAKGNINSTIHLTDDELLAEPALEPQGWGPTVNEVTVVYKDREHHFNDYTQVSRDPNNFRITGGPRPETLTRPWLTDATLAKQYARAAGAAMAMPFTRGELTVKREFLKDNALLPGMIFWFDSGFYGLSFLMRFLELEHAADSSPSATMTVEWERSKWPSLYVPPPFQGPGGFVLGPRAIWQSRITEIPYLLLDEKFDTQVVVHAVRQNVEVQGYRVWVSFDNGATYQMVPNASSTSAFSYFGRLGPGAIGTAETGMGFTLFGVGLDEVVSQTNAQWNDDNLLAFIDGEVISVGRIITHPHGFRTAFIKRGRFGTTPQAHAVNAQIFFIFRSEMKIIDNAGFEAGTVVKFKLQPFTADLDYDLASITAPPGLVTYTIIGFGAIPTPTCSPAPGVFNTQVLVSVAAPPAGFKVRFTRDNTPVTGSSPEWPKSGGVYTTSIINNTKTLRVRYYSTNGRFSGEFVGTWTKVVGSTPVNQCAPPGWSFSGTLKHTSGNLTLTQTTPGSVRLYKKNGGATITYSTPIALVCTNAGDEIEAWATHATMSDSAHRIIDNTKETTYGGGGHYPPRNPV